MDWTIVYQVTVFLGIALLAVVVTIFVLASSLLGLAVESASKEEEDRRAEQDSRIGKQVEQARTELEQAAAGTGEFERAEKTLKTLRDQKKKFEKETKRIRQGYEVFRPKGGVLYPGIPILVSLVLSALAWGLSMGTYQSISPYLWGFGVAALVFSLYRIYFGLKRIERVAVTSEQAALTRMTKALGTALEKHDEAIKPLLEFKFLDKEPPFHVKKESTSSFKYIVRLAQGDIVRRVEVWFLAPPGFSFPDKEKTWFQEKRSAMPSALTCSEELTDILPGISYSRTLQLKAPIEKDTFALGCRLLYEGAERKVHKFEVVVE